MSRINIKISNQWHQLNIYNHQISQTYNGNTPNDRTCNDPVHLDDCSLQGRVQGSPESMPPIRPYSAWTIVSWNPLNSFSHLLTHSTLLSQNSLSNYYNTIIYLDKIISNPRKVVMFPHFPCFGQSNGSTPLDSLGHQTIWVVAALPPFHRLWLLRSSRQISNQRSPPEWWLFFIAGYGRLWGWLWLVLVVMIGWWSVMVALKVFARGPGNLIFVEMVSGELKKTIWMYLNGLPTKSPQQHRH